MYWISSSSVAVLSVSGPIKLNSISFTVAEHAERNSLRMSSAFTNFVIFLYLVHASLNMIHLLSGESASMDGRSGFVQRRGAAGGTVGRSFDISSVIFSCIAICCCCICNISAMVEGSEPDVEVAADAASGFGSDIADGVGVRDSAEYDQSRWVKI